MSAGRDRWREAWRATTLAKRVLAIASAAILVAALSFSLSALLSPAWTPIARGLTGDDAVRLRALLDEAGIPNQPGRSAGAVDVPADRARQARALVARERPEIATDLAPITRETEIARTLEVFDGVRSARVHVAPAADGGVADRPRATVVLELDPQRPPERDAVRSAAVLVAAAVPGLRPTDVTITDGGGRTLWTGDLAGDDLGIGDLRALREASEREINAKVARVLAPLVGIGRFEVQSTVDLVEERVVRKETSLDPDSAVLLSHERKKEAGPGSGKSIRSEQSESFEYARVERTIEQPRGAARRLSVAVVVDGNALETGGQEETTAAVTLSDIESAVRSAIGYDATRGDVVTVTERPFALALGAPVETPIDPISWLPFGRLVALSLLSIVAIIVLGLIVRRGARLLATEAVPAGQDERDLLSLPASQRIAILRRRISDLTVNEPEGAASAMRVWLHSTTEGS